MEAGSRPIQTATLPPSKFHCLLDELPWHLVPRWFRIGDSLSSRSERPLFLNPQCSILSEGELPPELDDRRDLLEKFHLQGAIAWVRQPPADSLCPFWLGERLQETISRIKPGAPVSGSVSSNVASVLAAAGILISEKVANRNGEWPKASEQNQSEFQSRGYAPIGNLIHPFHIAALRRYYRHEIRSGAIRLGDEQSSRRYAVHNESVARFFHWQVANAVAAMVGEPIQPSYVYLSSYLSGADLKKHTDRAQCEFSVTLCLDFSPEPNLATSWPIRLDTPCGQAIVYQALGDGLLYRGTQLPHYRSILPAGYTSTSIFFSLRSRKFFGKFRLTQSGFDEIWIGEEKTWRATGVQKSCKARKKPDSSCRQIVIRRARRQPGQSTQRQS